MLQVFYQAKSTNDSFKAVRYWDMLILFLKMSVFSSNPYCLSIKNVENNHSLKVLANDALVDAPVDTK